MQILFLSFFLQFWFFVWLHKNYKHCLGAKNSLHIHVCAHIHNFVCMSLFLCVCVCVCVCRLTYKSMHVQVRILRLCEAGLPAWIFSYLFIPSTDTNVVLQQSSAPSSYILPCNMPCCLPGQCTLVVFKSHFPYSSTSFFSIINVFLKFIVRRSQHRGAKLK